MERSGRRYFMTGATGFVGGYLVRRLLNDGHSVAALVRNPSQAKDLEDLGAEIFHGDVTEKESMRAGMTGAEGVFHVAAWYKIGARDKSPAEKVNVGGTRNVLDLMHELEIPKGVYTSTLAINSDTDGKVYDETYHYSGEHISEYDRTKAAAHEVAMGMIAGGLPLVIVMPGLIYGPGDTSLVGDSFRQYLDRKLPVIPKESGFCWSHVEDIVTGHVLAMEKGRVGESYIIGGPRHTLVEAMELAEQVTGVPAPWSIPPGILSVSAPLMDVVGKILPLPDAYTGEGLRVSAGVTYYGDNTKAKRELGYDPRPLRLGMEQWLKREARGEKREARGEKREA